MLSYSHMKQIWMRLGLYPRVDSNHTVSSLSHEFIRINILGARLNHELNQISSWDKYLSRELN